MYKKHFLFCLLIVCLPSFVHAQLIDNRDLPQEELRIRPPFDATDRSQIAEKDDKVFIVLDNADDIRVKEFADSGTTETVMIGNVRIRFDGSHMKAEKLIITVKDSVVINVGAYGNVEFTLAGSKYLVDSLNYQPEMERGVMYNVRSVLGTGILGGGDKPWFYRAEKVTIQSPTRFMLDNVTMSTSQVRFDHFAVRASKLWYIQGKAAIAVGIEYLTGQTSFAWLPVFLQLEASGALRTSFGNEKRIGYYFINNITFDTAYGKFDVGFDFYERQGQYFQLDYAAPQIGMLKKFNFQTRLANDVRIIKNGDLFSQWVVPETALPNDFERITQFAWYYKMDFEVATNDISLQVQLEDLNDPFFIPKYSTRARFDSSQSINFAELLNPSLNSWYGYQGDAQPQLNTINRSFNLRAGDFNLSGQWELLQIAHPDPENHSNQFLNSFYDYEVRSMTLPSITYNFGTLDLFDYEHKTKSRLVILTSDGKSNTIDISKLPAYEKELAKRSNRSIQRRVVEVRRGIIETNVVTNWKPITITSIVTNDFTWADISLKASADVKFSAQKTFGTNDSSTVQDVALLNTNWVVITDLNQHEENGTLDLQTAFFDNIFTVNNNLKFNYREVWSSFGANFTNSQRESGLKMDYVIGSSLKPSKIWNDDEWYRTKLMFDSTVSFNYPLYYLLRLQTDFVRESFMTWNNSIEWEGLQWRRESILGLKAAAIWNIRDRVPTAEQAQIIATNENDIYLNNRIFDRLTLNATAKMFWINVGAETTLDILETTTNSSETAFVPVTGVSFTNKFIGSYPKLLVEFAPNATYHYLPKLIYRYNLFEESRVVTVTNIAGEIFPTTFRQDKSFNLEVVWDVKLKNYQIPALYPFIYEISEFGFNLQYYQDFINIRNSYLRLDFVFGVKFTKYLTFRFSSQMLNRSIYLYFPEIYNGSPVFAPGETGKDFFNDLWDGLQIWNTEALRRSSFKLQALNFELIHDLDSWDMRVIFNLGRRVDEVKQVAFWEPYIGVAFTMKGSNAANIFPEFQRRFVPAEYQ